MSRTRLAGLLAMALGPLGWCVVLGAVFGGDPMLSLELAGGAVVAVWAAFLTAELIGSHGLSTTLRHDARETLIFGVRCYVTPALRADAIVLGSVTPAIYVGAQLVAELSDEELQAVVYHEDHHRRTRAPLRAAALEAWLRLVGRSARLRDALLERLGDLEALADADAIARGSNPGSLARALLKGDPSLRPVSLGYATERRVVQLLDRAAGVPADRAARMPYEWLPVIVLTVATFACHVGL